MNKLFYVFVEIIIDYVLTIIYPTTGYFLKVPRVSNRTLSKIHCCCKRCFVWKYLQKYSHHLCYWQSIYSKQNTVFFPLTKLSLAGSINIRNLFYIFKIRKEWSEIVEVEEIERIALGTEGKKSKILQVNGFLLLILCYILFFFFVFFAFFSRWSL